MFKLSSENNSERIGERYKILRQLRWFLMLWVVLTYIWGIMPWGPRTPVLNTVFFLLLVPLHATGYWYSFNLSQRTLHFYFAVQGLFVIIIALISKNAIVTFSLYLALTVAAVVLTREVYWTIVLASTFMLLSMSLIWWFEGKRGIGYILIYLVPITLFTTAISAMFRQQITTRVKTQRLLQDLEITHRRLEEHAARVEELTLMMERQRMARELHDTLAQGLAGLILQLEAADSYLGKGIPERAKTIVRQAMERARAALADSRQAIDNLRSTASYIDLAEAVRKEAGRFTATTGILCKVEAKMQTKTSPLTSEAVLRIISEGLSNVARHARASQAWISLISGESSLCIELRDNGIGFDPAALGELPGHYGLLGLKERARLLGGTFGLISVPGEGTTLRFQLPNKDGVDAGG